MLIFWAKLIYRYANLFVLERGSELIRRMYNKFWIFYNVKVMKYILLTDNIIYAGN